MTDPITIYEVCYHGNDGHPLCMDPVFRVRTDAEAFAAKRDGCGLRYGAFVRPWTLEKAVADKFIRLR